MPSVRTTVTVAADMIEFKQVHKYYGAQTVLANADLQIQAGDRIGVVGPNGAGKTTVFALITGATTPDKGEVMVPANLRIGYLRQVLNPHTAGKPLAEYTADAVPELSKVADRLHAVEHALQDPVAPRARLLDELGHLQSRFEALGGYTLRTKAEAALGGLGFAAADFTKPMPAFSGGWQMRAELARTLVAEPDVLLLDEPSNYLDLPAVEWLQRYLRGFKGTLVLISHDRYLLNNLTTTTLELNAGRCTRYAGAYDAYRVAREKRVEQLAAQKKNQDQKRKQVERFVERFRAKNTKAAQVQSRIKMLEKMETIALPADLETRGRIRLPAPPHCGTEVMRLEKAGVAYTPDQWVLRGVDLTIRRGEKTALVGMNGLGKTTLLRVLAGTLPLTTGKRVMGHQVVPGHQTQDFAESMNPADTVFHTVYRVAADVPESQIRTLLGGFGFSGDAIEKPVSVLSGGEKIRLAFARLLVKPPNFLILDEPTTHLDVQARETLEAALRDYSGTCYFVSHDVAFVAAVATEIIAMEPPGIRRYPGDYQYYREKSAQLNGASTSTNEGKPTATVDRQAVRRARAERTQVRATEKRHWQKLVREAEKAIIALETEQADLVAKLETDDSQHRSFATINQRLTAIPELLAEWNRKWEDAVDALDRL